MRSACALTVSASTACLRAADARRLALYQTKRAAAVAPTVPTRAGAVEGTTGTGATVPQSSSSLASYPLPHGLVITAPRRKQILIREGRIGGTGCNRRARARGSIFGSLLRPSP